MHIDLDHQERRVLADVFAGKGKYTCKPSDLDYEILRELVRFKLVYPSDRRRPKRLIETVYDVTDLGKSILGER